MSKQKFDVNATAKKFLSVMPDTGKTEMKAAVSNAEKINRNYIPKGREIGANRPKGKDKNTGEVTKQIGYFVTDEQDRKLKKLAIDMNTNKSALLREALRMYFDYLEREGIK